MTGANPLHGDAIQEVFDLLDVAAKSYPVKALAYELYNDKGHAKAESTLRGELNQQPGHKLGLVTALHILERTKDFRALDRIEALFGRVAFPMPEARSGEAAPVVRLVAKLTQEFGGHMEALGAALDDGRITGEEAQTCLKELEDLIRACGRLQAHLEGIEKKP